MFNGFEEKIYGTESELDLGSFDYKYVLHNHPNNEFFSNKDLAYFATHPKTKLMGIVKHNGDILYLEKSKDFNFKKYYTEYNCKWQYQNVQKWLYKNVQNINPPL